MQIMCKKIVVAAIVLSLCLWAHAYSNHSSLRADPFNTIPDSNTATFRANSRIFWDHEQAQHTGKYLKPFVASGGFHGTAAGLVSSAFATEAYVPERVSQ